MASQREYMATRRAAATTFLDTAPTELPCADCSRAGFVHLHHPLDAKKPGAHLRVLANRGTSVEIIRRVISEECLPLCSGCTTERIARLGKPFDHKCKCEGCGRRMAIFLPPEVIDLETMAERGVPAKVAAEPAPVEAPKLVEIEGASLDQLALLRPIFGVKTPETMYREMMSLPDHLISQAVRNNLHEMDSNTLQAHVKNRSRGPASPSLFLAAAILAFRIGRKPLPSLDEAVSG